MKNTTPPKPFKATHKLPYDKGVWLRVMKVGDFWVTKEGRTFVDDKDGSVVPLKG